MRCSFSYIRSNRKDYFIPSGTERVCYWYLTIFLKEASAAIVLIGQPELTLGPQVCIHDRTALHKWSIAGGGLPVINIPNNETTDSEPLAIKASISRVSNTVFTAVCISDIH